MFPFVVRSLVLQRGSEVTGVLRYPSSLGRTWRRVVKPQGLHSSLSSSFLLKAFYSSPVLPPLPLYLALLGVQEVNSRVTGPPRAWHWGAQSQLPSREADCSEVVVGMVWQFVLPRR